MTDEMKRLIRATTDEGPRPGFVLELRSALVDELETLDTNKTPADEAADIVYEPCLLYTSPSPRDQRGSRMPSSA